jgi:uncharacterized protein DUF5829
MRRAILVGVIMLLLCFSGLEQVKMNLRDSIALNHFYVVLDSATYKAIEQSPFLRQEFAVTEQRTTTRTDISYTGVYFYGANTYFEFFDVANQSMGRLGDGGIALGVDQPGGMDAIKRELGDQFSIAQAPITRQFGQEQVPWFYTAGFTNFPLDSGLRIWAMEYHPRFLAEWNPPSTGKSEGVSRKQVLQRYVDVLKAKSAKPYLKDVVALTIAVSEATQKRFGELGKRLGYGVRVEGMTTILEGPDLELRLIPQTDKLHGIQEITMRVAAKPNQAEFRFGARSVLKFGGNGLATWSF